MASNASSNITMVSNITANDLSTFDVSSLANLTSANVSDISSLLSTSSPVDNSHVVHVFPETDADAAAGFSPKSIHSDVLFSSPEAKTSDLCHSSPHSLSLPNLNEGKVDDIDPRVLKSLFDYMLDACKKLYVLYSDLDNKVNGNVRSLNEKLSTLNFLHQTSFTESLKECRDSKRELSERLDKVDGSYLELNTKWTEQIELLKSNFNAHDSSSVTSNDSIASDDTNATYGPLQALDSEVSRMNDSFTKLSDEMHQLDCRLVECEQYPRRDNIIISGIPDNVSQNDLKDQVYDIVDAIGLNLPDNSISACHRLPKGRSRWPAKTIVRFVNREDAEFCLSNRNKLKSRGVRNNLNGLNLRIYENLCKSNNDVLHMGKWLQENGYIKSYFLRNGFVKIVVNEGDQPVKVNHPQLLRDRFPIIPENLHML